MCLLGNVIGLCVFCPLKEKKKTSSKYRIIPNQDQNSHAFFPRLILEQIPQIHIPKFRQRPRWLSHKLHLVMNGPPNYVHQFFCL